MKRTLTFLILTWLTVVNIVTLIVATLCNWLLPEATGDAIKVLFKINAGLVLSDVPEAAYYVPVLVFLLLAAFGLRMNFNHNKKGRWLTFIGLMVVAVSLAAPMLMIGNPPMSLMLVAVFNLILAVLALVVKQRSATT